MIIAGLQKLTLLDYPGRVACTVFLAGCDFRCPYCHNAELLTRSVPPAMTGEELTDFLRKRKGLLDGVCVTGGEPTLWGDELFDLLGKIKAIGYSVKLDTNGGHPDMLKRLAAQGLIDYVAMDVKNSPDRYAQTCGLIKLDLTPIQESVSLLLSGAIPCEFRTTVVDELFDESSFHKIGVWLRGAQRYFLQPFVDRDTVPLAGLHAPTEEKMERYLEIVQESIPNATIRGVS